MQCSRQLIRSWADWTVDASGCGDCYRIQMEYDIANYPGGRLQRPPGWVVPTIASHGAAAAKQAQDAYLAAKRAGGGTVVINIHVTNVVIHNHG